MPSSRRMTTHSKKAVPTTGPVIGPGSVSEAQLGAFAGLFNGYSKGYGRTDLTGSRGKRNDNGKIQGQSWTERGEPTLAHYRAHLEGVGHGLGIFPLRDDDTVVFGAIDIDRYDLNHAELEARITRLGLPLIMFKSKSGGAHLYCFTTAPVEASLMRDRLAEYAALLGHAKQRNGKDDTELFPKQSARFNDTDWGSWINLPYYHAVATNRAAFIGGQEVELAVFLRTALDLRVAPDSLETPVSAQDSTLFKDGPPCLIQLHAEGGFVEGTRNDGMMAAIVYCRKRWPDTWEDHVDEVNSAMANLPAQELVQLIKSHQKKEYNYSCKKSPLNAVCQRRKCTQREYGIGQQSVDSKTLDITSIIRYDTVHGDEPLWRMEISGKPLMVTNSQFYNKDDFNRQAMAQANLVPVRCSPAIWQKTLGELIATAEVHMMPDDAGPTGQLWGWIERFLTQRVSAAVKEEIVLGKPWREEGRVHFRSQDLFSFLDSHKVEYKSQQAVWVLLHTHGATKDGWHLKGQYVNVWAIAAPTVMSDEDVPPLTLVQDDAF